MVPGSEKALEISLEFMAGQCRDVDTHRRALLKAKSLKDVPQGCSARERISKTHALLVEEGQFAFQWARRFLENTLCELCVQVVPFIRNVLHGFQRLAARFLRLAAMTRTFRSRTHCLKPLACGI